MQNSVEQIADIRPCWTEMLVGHFFVSETFFCLFLKNLGDLLALLVVCVCVCLTILPTAAMTGVLFQSNFVSSFQAENAKKLWIRPDKTTTVWFIFIAYKGNDYKTSCSNCYGRNAAIFLHRNFFVMTKEFFCT